MRSRVASLFSPRCHSGSGVSTAKVSPLLRTSERPAMSSMFMELMRREGSEKETRWSR